MTKCTCCYIDQKTKEGCGADATVEIRDVPETPCGYTHACAKHVDDLSSDGPHTFHAFRIPGDSDTISDRPHMTTLVVDARVILAAVQSGIIIDSPSISQSVHKANCCGCLMADNGRIVCNECGFVFASDVDRSVVAPVVPSKMVIP